MIIPFLSYKVKEMKQEEDNDSLKNIKEKKFEKKTKQNSSELADRKKISVKEEF